VERERRERISAESGCETQAAARYAAEVALRGLYGALDKAFIAAYLAGSACDAIDAGLAALRDTAPPHPSTEAEALAAMGDGQALTKVRIIGP
jgi:hypothetical protein